MPMIEISQETYDLLKQAAPFEFMLNTKNDEIEEAEPEALAEVILWRATQDIIRKHRDEDNLRIGALPYEMDDNIPF